MLNEELSAKGVKLVTTELNNYRVGNIYFLGNVYVMESVEQSDGSFKIQARKFVTGGSTLDLPMFKDTLLMKSNLLNLKNK